MSRNTRALRDAQIFITTPGDDDCDDSGMNSGEQRLSYNSCLPVSPSELNLVLVGPSKLCKPLASALVHHHVDRRRTHHTDAAIAALEKRRVSKSPRRNIHMIEDWNDFPQHIPIHHVVIVVSPTNVEKSIQRLKRAADVLDESYVSLQRISVVLMLEPTHGVRDSQPITSLLNQKTTSDHQSSLLFQSPVSCFPCQLQHRSSHLTVSRILLQRIKLASRSGRHVVSPMLFANYR